MSEEKPRITYRFHLPDGVEETILEFDPATYTLCTRPDLTPPEWAALEFHKCGHCPLTVEDTPTCPFAAALARYVKSFGHLYSHEKVEIEVITETRTVTGHKPLQTGIASLVGLLGATSGCPHLAFYRPMARFHSPFADEQETLYRVLSMFTVQSLFAGRAPDYTDLSQVMTAVGDVNAAMADRVRSGFDKDAMVNAIVILDFFAMNVPMEIDTEFDSIRYLFKD
jgi:hypothetical protein